MRAEHTSEGFPVADPAIEDSADFGAFYIASAYAALDVIRFLGRLGEPFSANQRVGIHTNSLRIQRQKYERRAGCEVCTPL